MTKKSFKATVPRAKRKPRTKAAPVTPATGVVVLGNHRSGTSMLAGVCHLLGFNMGANLLPPAPDNPWGFFEEGAAVAANDLLLRSQGYNWDAPPPEPLREPEPWSNLRNWQTAVASIKALAERRLQGGKAWGLKDPRLAFTLPVWMPHLGEGWKIVSPVRDVADIAASLQARHPKHKADWLALAKAYDFAVSRGLSGCRIDVLRVPFTDILGDPEKWVLEIQTFLTGNAVADDRTGIAVAHVRRRPSGT